MSLMNTKNLKWIVPTLALTVFNANADTVQVSEFCGGAVGHYHKNGGGFVANTAHVDETAFVEKGAQVCDRAQVRDEAHVWNTSVISERAQISKKVHVNGDSRVSGDAKITDNAIIGSIGGTNGLQRAVVNGATEMYNGSQVLNEATVTGAILKDQALVDGHATIMSLGKVVLRGSANVSDYATVKGSDIEIAHARIQNHTKILDQAKVVGNSVIAEGRLEIFGYAEVSGQAIVTEGARVACNAVVTDRAQVSGKRTLITGSTRITGNRKVKKGNYSNTRQLTSIFGFNTN